MDVKEKLVKLLKTDICPSPLVCDPACRYSGCDNCFPERYADHLIANGVTVQEWIPVTERLPETCGYPVLMVAVNKYGQKKIVKGFTNYECPVEFCTNEKEYDLCWHCWEVTHWMPLPAPPKGE